MPGNEVEPGDGYVGRTPEDLISDLIERAERRLRLVEIPSGLFTSRDRKCPSIIALQGDYIPPSSEWSGVRMYLLIVPNAEQSEAGELPREIGFYPNGLHKSRARSETGARIDAQPVMLDEEYLIEIQRCVQDGILEPFTAPGYREPQRHQSPRLGSDPLVA